MFMIDKFCFLIGYQKSPPRLPSIRSLTYKFVKNDMIVATTRNFACVFILYLFKSLKLILLSLRLIVVAQQDLVASLHGHFNLLDFFVE